MGDRSSIPRHQPGRTPAHIEQQVVGLRTEHRIGPVRLAARTGPAASTCHRILRRHGLPPLTALDDHSRLAYSEILTDEKAATCAGFPRRAKEQTAKGGRDEGFSIPAQREANARKAESLGARGVAEFVDAGESARSADRPDLQRMLEYIATHQVSYCIAHKVDRLARNRGDDVEIHRRLVEAGVTLVSATENIDETPSGMLLHGIM